MRNVLQSSRQNKSRDISFAAPTGGWNARDPVASMSPKDAQWLENFFVRGTAVEARKGCTKIGHIPAGQIIKTVLPYNPATGLMKLFAVAPSGIYDLTAPFINQSDFYVSSPAFAGPFASAMWEYVNVSTEGGNFLVMVNGADEPILYDGTTWKHLNGSSTPPLSGARLS